MALDWGHFYSLGDTWECLKIFLVVTVAGVPLASNREARQPTTMKNYALLNFNCAGIEKPCFKGGHPWASVPAHLFTSCVTLFKTVKLGEPQFPHL